MAHTRRVISERLRRRVLGRLKFTRGPVDMAVFCAAAIGTTIRTTAARRIATGTRPTTATTTTGSVVRWGVSDLCGPEWRPSRWPAARPESPNRIPVLPRADARETNAIVAPAGPCSDCPGRGVERSRVGCLAARPVSCDRRVLSQPPARKESPDNPPAAGLAWRLRPCA